MNNISLANKYFKIAMKCSSFSQAANIPLQSTISKNIAALEKSQNPYYAAKKGIMPTQRAILLDLS
ncbi:MAG: LysR family transcriptional regulator [Enterocloster bolteae]